MGRVEVRALLVALLTGQDASAEAENWQETDSRDLAALSAAVFHDVVASRFTSPSDPAIQSFVRRVLSERRRAGGEVSADVAEAAITSMLGAYEDLDRVPRDQVLPVQVLLSAAALSERAGSAADVDAIVAAAEPTAWAAVQAPGETSGERPP